jgi:uncharacterized protein (TIGR03000 family)
MYSVVLMVALSGGADVPAWDNAAAEPAAKYGDHGHKQYRCGGRRGCHGGGGCSGGGCYGGGCYGGWGGYRGGCYGGGYGGCWGGYGGCSGGCYGSYGYGSYGYGSYGSGGMPYASGYYGSMPGYNYGQSPEQGDQGYYAQGGEAPATIVVRLPADARLTVDGNATRSTDSVRTFISPPLQPGKEYTYTLRAEVTRDGKKTERSRDVTVRAGGVSEVTLDLSTSGGSSGD